jgi:hypothetical protein
MTYIAEEERSSHGYKRSTKGGDDDNSIYTSLNFSFSQTK